MGSVTVVVVDDHPLFRAGVARSLSETPGFEIVGEGSTNGDAMQLANKYRPDIMLLDVSIPGGGLNAVNAILEQRPDQKIVMLTVSEAGGDVTKALKFGARGYILKGVEAESLANILLAIASGERYVSPALSARLLSGHVDLGRPPTATKDLGERQRHILRLVCMGRSNKEIAIELDLQEKTIKHQLTRIFLMLDVSNRTEAAMVFRNAEDAGYDPESLRSRA